MITADGRDMRRAARVACIAYNLSGESLDKNLLADETRMTLAVIAAAVELGVVPPEDDEEGMGVSSEPTPWWAKVFMALFALAYLFILVNLVIEF